jgi:large subunit ribosomal protein L41
MVKLKPYVSTKVPRLSDLSIASSSSTPLPSFSPNALPAPSAERYSTADFTKFSKRYQRASLEERQALIQASRREWWEAMRGRFGGQEPGAEESTTRSVEGRAAVA